MEETENKWGRLFFNCVTLLFIFTFIGFKISQITGNTIEGMYEVHNRYIYNLFFEVLGVLVIVISKIKFDNKVIKIKSSLERK